MKTNLRFSSSRFVVVSLLAASIACSGKALDVGTAEPGVQHGDPPASSDLLPGGPLTVSVLAKFEEHIGAIAVDATHVYLGGDGNVYAVPKSGGDVVTLLADEPVVSTPKTSVAVDDTHVYFSSLEWMRIARVPKAGGAVEILADGLGSPRNLTIDATHVYFSVADGIAGGPQGPAIVRVSKAGGPIEVVAGEQPLVTSLALRDGELYFASGYASPDGSLRRVSKKRGDVTTLVHPLDTRSTAGAPQVSTLVPFGDKLAFVEPASGTLAFAPLAGGEVEVTSLALDQDSLVANGSSLVAAALDRTTWTGSLLRVDASGTAGAPLAQWSYADAPKGSMASISASTAMTIDASGVYWVDFDNHTASTSKPLSAKLRSAKAD